MLTLYIGAMPLEKRRAGIGEPTGALSRLNTRLTRYGITPNHSRFGIIIKYINIYHIKCYPYPVPRKINHLRAWVSLHAERRITSWDVLRTSNSTDPRVLPSAIL